MQCFDSKYAMHQLWDEEYRCCIYLNRGPGPLLKKCSGLAQVLSVTAFCLRQIQYLSLTPSFLSHTYSLFSLARLISHPSVPSFTVTPSLSLYSWIPSQVKAMYNYKGQGLGLTKGEVFYLLKKSNKDWWSVRWRSCDLITMTTWSAIFIYH